MSSPLVSVILPTYNRASLLPRAIKSVLNQTYKSFELIIIDDNSTDNTKKNINDFKDKRIKYIWHKENKGAAASRNKGIKLAKGEYIAFQDSDDEWFPKKLEKHISAFKNLSSKYGIVYSDCLIIEGNKKHLISSKYKQRSGFIMKDIFRGNFITMQVMIKKRCFITEGLFDEELSRLQDWELWIRFSRKYYFKYISEPLTKVYRQKSSISSNIDALIESTKLILNKHKKYFNKDKYALGKRLAILADIYARKGDFQTAKKIYINALKLNKNFKYILAFVLLIIFPNKIYNKILNKFISYN